MNEKLTMETINAESQKEYSEKCLIFLEKALKIDCEECNCKDGYFK